MRSQTHRQEIIEGLAAMVAELLEDFRASVGELPRRVVFFRDGVSETQFHRVLREELPAIKSAFSRFGSYDPPVTFASTTRGCSRRGATRTSLPGRSWTRSSLTRGSLTFSCAATTGSKGRAGQRTTTCSETRAGSRPTSFSDSSTRQGTVSLILNWSNELMAKGNVTVVSNS